MQNLRSRVKLGGGKIMAAWRCAKKKAMARELEGCLRKGEAQETEEWQGGQER